MGIHLSFEVTTNPDFGGFRFYVEEGRSFDDFLYAEAYKLKHDEIHHQDIHRIQDAARNLNKGEWLEVTHETVD